MRARAAEQYDRLRRQGLLELGADRRPLAVAWSIVGVAVVLAACACWAALSTKDGPGGPGTGMLLAFWIPFIIIPALVALVPTLMAARRRPQLVVSADGVEEYVTRHGRRVRVGHYRWADVEQVRLVRGRHPRVGLQLTPQRHEQYLREWPAVPSVVMRMANVLGPRLVLLSDYEGGPKVTVDLLQQVHRDVTGLH